MGRTAWTDERLDDLARRVDDGFDRVDADIRDLRQTMEGRFNAMDTSIDQRFNAMDTSIDQRFNAIDQRFNSLETRISWFGGGLLLTMFATILSNLL